MIGDMRTGLVSTLLAVTASACWTDPAPVTTPTPPQAAHTTPRCDDSDCMPRVAVVDTAGHRHGAAELAGKIVIVNFWATWLSPSRREVLVLSSIAAAYADRGVIVLGLLTDSPDDTALAAYTATTPIAYPIVRVTPALAAAYAYPQALPTTFVFGRNGHRIAQHVGPLTEDALRAILDPAL
jgi:thiol-disulfide isomerase/thioredoxin